MCCLGESIRPHLDGLLRCVPCGHVWADMGLTDDALRALYAEQYFKGDEYLDYEREERALRKNFRKSLRDIRRMTPDGGRLWEVGSAYGYFLDEAAHYFEVAGCDISQDAVEQAVERFGHPAACLDYLSKEREPEAYDVVCMWDTVEHLTAPDAYLSRVHFELKRGGVLALSTGDIGALLPRWRGRHWRLIHPPTHLHYFTRHSMRALLGRLGFSEIAVHHRAFWRSADAVAYRVMAHRRSGMGPALYRWLSRTGLLRMSLPMNTFDLMTVYARKR